VASTAAIRSGTGKVCISILSPREQDTLWCDGIVDKEDPIPLIESSVVVNPGTMVSPGGDETVDGNGVPVILLLLNNGSGSDVDDDEENDCNDGSYKPKPMTNGTALNNRRWALRENNW
jgi:hypothetical protein